MCTPCLYSKVSWINRFYHVLPLRKLVCNIGNRGDSVRHLYWKQECRLSVCPLVEMASQDRFLFIVRPDIQLIRSCLPVSVRWPLVSTFPVIYHNFSLCVTIPWRNDVFLINYSTFLENLLIGRQDYRLVLVPMSMQISNFEFILG